ncbi:MAG TPA: hypothetical protein PK082_11370, partial [Phycisphaerae bacterium]|nr:hypothetical protein [Phycisphaerae bacterium]
PDKPLASKVLMHYKLTNDEKHKMGLWPLQPGKVRIFIQDARGGEAFLGEDWAQLTPLDDHMKLYLGEARDIVCTRIIESNERHPVRGNLVNQEVVVKYEIENFKDQPVSLDVQENLPHVRREIPGYAERGRDAQWEILPETNLEGGPDQEKTTVEDVLFHVSLPARAKDGKAEKLVRKLHVKFRNEW